MFSGTRPLLTLTSDLSQYALSGPNPSVCCPFIFFVCLYCLIIITGTTDGGVNSNYGGKGGRVIGDGTRGTMDERRKAERKTRDTGCKTPPRHRAPKIYAGLEGGHESAAAPPANESHIFPQPFEVDSSPQWPTRQRAPEMTLVVYGGQESATAHPPTCAANFRGPLKWNGIRSGPPANERRIFP